MNGEKPLKCQKCGRTMGYVSLTAKSYLAAKPNVDNVKVIGTCSECHNGRGFYHQDY